MWTFIAGFLSGVFALLFGFYVFICAVNSEDPRERTQVD